VEFGPSKHLLWKQPLPLGHSSLAVWGDRIFLTAFDPKSRELELICITAKTGAILWRRVAPANQIEETHVVGNLATGTPTVDDPMSLNTKGSGTPKGADCCAGLHDEVARHYGCRFNP
jgi:hypothetical protein